jgi:hypothetical protein
MPETAHGYCALSLQITISWRTAARNICYFAVYRLHLTTSPFCKCRDGSRDLVVFFRNCFIQPAPVGIWCRKAASFHCNVAKEYKKRVGESMRLDIARIEHVLREHVGAFAPIVVQDAIAASGIDVQAPQPRDFPVFLMALNAALPADINKRAVLVQIQKLIGM